jgi:hypothetical protein
MTAQATAMPRQHPQGLNTVSGDRRHRRRALATAAIALAAPLSAVTVLAALGAATDSGGAGLGSLPGASGLKGESGAAVPSQPLGTHRSKDYGRDFEKSGGGSAKERTASGPPDSNGRDTATKLPRQPVPAGFGDGRSPVAIEPSDYGQPGYPGGDTNVASGISGGSGSSGSSSSDSDDSGSSDSGVSSGTSGSGGEFSG